jgi:hypothetical protein
MRLLSLSLLLLASCLARPLSAEEPQAIELTLYPQAIEGPPLKYRLLPGELELREGNAVPILLRLPWEQNPWMQQVYPTLHEWEELPLDDPRWKEAGNVIPENFFREMKRAAFRRDADWEYPIGEQTPLYSILLPDMQGLRVFLLQGLSIRARYHMVQGEHDQAREAILVGLANSRHVAKTPFFVNQLVAVAIQRTMLHRVDELVSQPGSPNLYWSLTALPPSLLQLERAASLEGDAFASMLPAASELDRPRSKAEWRRMAEQLAALLVELQEMPPPKEREKGNFLQEYLQALKGAERAHLKTFYESARAELAQLAKIPDDRVAEMTNEEVAVRWYVAQRLELDHRRAALMTLPPTEAWPHLVALHNEAQDLRKKTGAETTRGFIMVPGVYAAAWNVNRKVAALRVIEAVRHHAAQHEGRLPERLDDVKGLPIPLDPLTGKPFEWEATDGTATLVAPSLPADVAEAIPNLADSLALRYKLTLSSSK